jgi:hypothetical protein
MWEHELGSYCSEKRLVPGSSECDNKSQSVPYYTNLKNNVFTMTNCVGILMEKLLIYLVFHFMLESVSL